MKKIYFLVTQLLVSIGACSQGCLPEGIKIFTQPKIEYFQTQYPVCTRIDWNVTINGDFITNLNRYKVLTSLGGKFEIGINESLESLVELNNINPASIDHLQICGNPSLSECAVQNIFDYLLSPGGATSITDNTFGCSNRPEVEAAFALGVEEVNSRQLAISSYPNRLTWKQ